MAFVTGEQRVFCADLKDELTQRTTALVADERILIADKLKGLNEVKGTYNDFNIDATLHAIERAAKERNVVAALVTCPAIPVMEGVFLGYLDTKEPLKFEEDGRYRINVTSGQIARVLTTRRARDGGRFQIAQRYTVSEGVSDPVTVENTGLSVLSNEIHDVTSSFTAHADNVLNQAAGLDHKIVYEGTNLPKIEANGDLLNTYDRLNIVKGLGENAFRAMWGSITETVSVAS